MIVADADILNVVRLQLQLGEQLGDGFLRRLGSRTLPETGIPHHVVVAVLDQVAAEYELEFQAVEVICVGKAQGGARTRADIPRRRDAAFEARERYLGCRRGRPLRQSRDGRQRICADADRQHA